MHRTPACLRACASRLAPLHDLKLAPSSSTNNTHYSWRACSLLGLGCSLEQADLDCSLFECTWWLAHGHCLFALACPTCASCQVYLDTTYADPKHEMPLQNECVRFIANKIKSIMEQDEATQQRTLLLIASVALLYNKCECLPRREPQWCSFPSPCALFNTTAVRTCSLQV